MDIERVTTGGVAAVPDAAQKSIQKQKNTLSEDAVTFDQKKERRQNKNKQDKSKQDEKKLKPFKQYNQEAVVTKADDPESSDNGLNVLA